MSLTATPHTSSTESITQGVEAIRLATYNQIQSRTSSPNKSVNGSGPFSPTAATSKRAAGGFSRSLRAQQRFASNEEKQTISQKELKRAFASFDRDQSGTIDKAELAAVLRSVGKSVPEDQIDEIMKEIDLDQNGVLDFSEFEYIVQVKLEDNYHDEQSLRELFEFFDRDHDGFISFDELYYVLNKKLQIKIGREDVQDMLRYADLDGNNLISLKEFSILFS